MVVLAFNTDLYDKDNYNRS